MKPKLKGSISVERLFNEKRGFKVIGGHLEFENDKYKLEVFSTPNWNTDFGSVPDMPIVNYLIPYIGEFLDPAYIAHDALWQCRVFMNNYDMEFTNDVLVDIAKVSLKTKCGDLSECDGMAWYKKVGCKAKRYWCQAYGWAQIKAVKLALSGITAQNKWNNPSEEVEKWQHEIVTITLKDKK